MSFEEYLQQEIRYIIWYGKHFHVTLDEASQLWVHTGMAKLYADKYRSVLKEK